MDRRSSRRSRSRSERDREERNDQNDIVDTPNENYKKRGSPQEQKS
jgi:hypothetical protein